MYYTRKMKNFLKKKLGTPLVVQWIQVRLTVQGTWVQSLVQEDSMGHREAESVATTMSLHTLSL